MTTFTLLLAALSGAAVVAAARLDGAIVARMAQGDSDALRMLYDAVAGRTLAIALRVLGDRAEAEDVVQEAMLETWRRAREFDATRGGVEAWVVTIARSRAIDRKRSRTAAARTKLAAKDEPMPKMAASPELDVAAAEERARVLAALDRLPTEQRRAIELAYYEGLSQSEIADRTGDPLGTVKTRIRLAMEKLAEAMPELARGAGARAPARDDEAGGASA